MKAKSVILATVAALLFPLAVVAGDSGKLVEVVATGHGSTVREAKKAALRAAVEQVVGTMIDATTLVENDELIEDEILTYAPGMVEKSIDIGEPKKSEDGFFTVKIKATVKKGKLEEKLRAASAVSVALDGQDLFARMTAAQDNLADAEAMIEDVLSKNTSCIVAEIVPGANGTSPIDFDPKTEEIFASVRVRLDQAKYRQFAGEVLEKLTPMAEKAINIMGTDSSSYWRFRQENGKRIFDSGTTILFVIDNMRTLHAAALIFDKNKFDAISKAFFTGTYVEIGARRAVRVMLRDALCDQLSVGQKEFPNTNLSLLGRYGSSQQTPSTCVIAPFCGGEFDSSGDFSKNKCWTEKTFRISLGKFSADELKSAGKLTPSIVQMKNGQFGD